MDVNETLIVELQGLVTGAQVHWAYGIEAAYRGLVRLSKTAASEERREQAERKAREIEEQIRQALTELRATGYVSAETRRET